MAARELLGYDGPNVLRAKLLTLGDLSWLVPLPAFFLPDLYALWTLHRRRGRLFVARAMVALAALSSLPVAWLGSGLFLA